jgi:manganese/zinc/iron transport system permease protein
MSFVVSAVLLAMVIAVACALPGVFLVLRRESMLIEAISHAVLPGIVVGYAITRDLTSPLLLVGAAIAGLVVVVASEFLGRTGLLAGDAPQGLVFPMLFSIGIILLSTDFGHLHLDAHIVFAGDLNLAAFNQMTVNGTSIGPAYLYVMLGVLGVNAAFLALLYPRLKISTFDRQYAATLIPRVGRLSSVFMLLVAVTATASFNGAGAILVVALIVVPPATAHLLTSRLSSMIVLTVVIAAGGALAGFWVAYWFDAATSAGMAVFYGILFATALVLTRLRQRRRRRTAGPGARATGEPAAIDRVLAAR